MDLEEIEYATALFRFKCRTRMIVVRINLTLATDLVLSSVNLV